MPEVRGDGEEAPDVSESAAEGPQGPASPVSSVNGKTGAVVLSAADVGAATSSQGDTADTALQPGDNVSALVNDAGFITDSSIPEVPVQEAPLDGKYYVRQNGAWIDLATAIADLTIDSGLIT